MPEQTTTQWTQQQWDHYLEQTQNAVTYPDIGAHQPLRYALPQVTYTCPFCLRSQPGMDLELPEGAETFTATWRECGHRVSVPVAETIPPPSFPTQQNLIGIARFRCPRDCGWTHDESPDLDPLPPVRLPARTKGSTLAEVLSSTTAEELSAAIGAAAEERARTFRARLEQAYAAHYDLAHPGIAAPTLAS